MWLFKTKINYLICCLILISIGSISYVILSDRYSLPNPSSLIPPFHHKKEEKPPEKGGEAPEQQKEEAPTTETGRKSSRTSQRTLESGTQIANLVTNWPEYQERGSTPELPKITKYDIFELTFDIYRNGSNLNEAIEQGEINPYWPYDENPAANTSEHPNAVPAGVGISVDGLFLPPGETDWNKAVVQPGFYYQDYDLQIINNKEWLYPKGNPVWKIRFAPTKEGNWQYKIRIRDASGESFSDSIGSFSVISSSKHGFVKVSEKDGRYFETSDGHYLNLVGLNDYTRIPDASSRYSELASKGVNFLRVWWQASQYPAVFGISGQGGFFNWHKEYPGVWSFYMDVAYGSNVTREGELFSIPIDGTRGTGAIGTSAYVKPNSRYKFSAWIKTVGLEGTGDYGAYLSVNNSQEGTGPLTTKLKGDTEWTEVSATINTKSDQYEIGLYAKIINTTAGKAYITDMSLKEDLGDGNYSSELISRPNFNVYKYVSPFEAYKADYITQLAKNNGIYLRVVTEEKADEIWGRIQSDGTAGSRSDNNVYASDTHASRTYQTYYWRYLIARYSAYTNIHSWEFVNEGDPFNANHYNAVEAFGKYFHNNDPNRHLVSTSTWHSFPQDLWRNSNVDVADLHNFLVSYLWPGWDGNWSDTNRKQTTLTTGYEFDNTTAHSGRKSLKLTVPPNVNSEGEFKENESWFSPNDCNLFFHAGVEPGHKIRLSAWIKAQNLTNFTWATWQMPSLGIYYVKKEGEWNGWPSGTVRVPAGNSTNRGPWTYDWQLVTYETYVPSYYGVVIDSEGKINVANAGPTNYTPNRSHIIFSQDVQEGQRTNAIAGPAMKSMAIDSSGNRYYPDIVNHKIFKYDSNNSWPPLGSWGSYGSGDGQFDTPSGIVLDADGNMYITDTNNHRVQKLNGSGTFVTKWGSRGTNDGQFNYPTGIAIDSRGNIYIADTGNHRIQKFNSSGGFIAKFGSYGNGRGQFNEPRGVAVDNRGFIYVADTKNHRIQKFDSNGVFVKAWGSYGTDKGQFKEPQAVAVDSNNNVYVADTGNVRIQKFDQDGEFIRIYNDTSEFSGAGAFMLGVNPRMQSHASTTPAYVWFDDIELRDLNTNKVLNFNGGFENTDRTGYDVVAGYQTLSRKGASYQLNKPIVQSEAYINAPQRFGDYYKGFSQYEGDQLLIEDTEGVWYRKLIWSHIDSSGLTKILWGMRGIFYARDYRYAKAYQNFMEDIPLTNGNYQDIEAEVSDVGIRVLGQKDLVNNRAHLWIDNASYTWKAVADHNFNTSDIAWSSTVTYAQGALASDPNNPSLVYRSLQDSNRNHPLSDSDWWENRSSDWYTLLDMEEPNPALPSPVSGTVTISGFSDGTYTVEWWNTSTGSIIRTEEVTSSNGNIVLNIVNLQSDIAAKIYYSGSSHISLQGGVITIEKLVCAFKKIIPEMTIEALNNSKKATQLTLLKKNFKL